MLLPTGTISLQASATRSPCAVWARKGRCNSVIGPDSMSGHRACGRTIPCASHTPVCHRLPARRLDSHTRTNRVSRYPREAAGGLCPSCACTHSTPGKTLLRIAVCHFVDVPGSPGVHRSNSSPSRYPTCSGGACGQCVGGGYNTPDTDCRAIVLDCRTHHTMTVYWHDLPVIHGCTIPVVARACSVANSYCRTGSACAWGPLPVHTLYILCPSAIFRPPASALRGVIARTYTQNSLNANSARWRNSGASRSSGEIGVITMGLSEVLSVLVVPWFLRFRGGAFGLVARPG